MKCSKCGCESPLENLFKSNGASFQLLRRQPRVVRLKYCPACVRRDENLGHIVIIALLAFVAALWAVTIFRRSGPGGSNLPELDESFVNLMLLMPLQYLCIIPHELGHVAGARLVGIDVLKISFGRGRRIARWLIGSVPIELHPIPIAGFVVGSTASTRLWRLRRIVFSASGPLANLVLVIAGIALGGGWDRFINYASWIHEISPWQDLDVANLVLLLSALVPQKVQFVHGETASDGLKLYGLLFKPLPSVAARRKIDLLVRGLHCMWLDKDRCAIRLLRRALREFPRDNELAVNLAVAMMNAGRHQDGIDLVSSGLAVHHTPSAFRATLLNCSAWAKLMIATPDSIAEAGIESAEALRLMPWEASIQSTRGLYLVETGQVSQAIPLLRQAERGAILPEQRACVFCSLAIANLRQGTKHRAAKFIHKARKLDPNCQLLGRAESEMKSPHWLRLKGSQPVGA